MRNPEQGYPVISADTETDGLNFRKDKLRLVQLCNEHDNTIFIKNPDHTSFNLIGLMQHYAIDWIFHNAFFDLTFLFAYIGQEVNGHIFCTKTISKIVEPEQSTGLNKIMKRHFNIDMPNIKHNWAVDKLSKEQIHYAASDVTVLKRVLDCYRKGFLDNYTEDIHDRAIQAIRDKVFIETQGYTGIFEYASTEKGLLKKQIEWWKQQPFNRER